MRDANRNSLSPYYISLLQLKGISELRSVSIKQLLPKRLAKETCVRGCCCTRSIKTMQENWPLPSVSWRQAGFVHKHIPLGVQLFSQTKKIFLSVTGISGCIIASQTSQEWARSALMSCRNILENFCRYAFSQWRSKQLLWITHALPADYLLVSDCACILSHPLFFIHNSKHEVFASEVESHRGLFPE